MHTHARTDAQTRTIMHARTHARVAAPRGGGGGLGAERDAREAGHGATR